MPVPPVDIPVVTLTGPDAATQLWSALSTLGCAYVVAHGVPRRTVDALFAATRAFFAQPEAVKMRVAADAKFRGYTPLGDESLDLADTADEGSATARPAGGGDRKAGLYFGRDLAADHPDAALPLHGPNQWPDGVPGFKDAVQDAQDALEGLAERLVPVIGDALAGDAPAVFAAAFLTPPRRAMAFLRPLFYPARGADDDERAADAAIGAGAHTDYGFATLLLVDRGAPGLEVEVPGAGWRSVPPGPPGRAGDPADDTFAIFFNCGDMLHRWSAGRCLSARHRVAAPAAGAPARHSAAFFYDPPADCVCAPLGGGEETAAAWPPVRYLDYLQARFAATHASYGAATGGSGG